MSDLSELIIAGTGVLATVGAAGRFVWNKIERRFEEVEAKLEDCHARELKSQHRRSVMSLAIELLLQEIDRLSPRKSRVTARVKGMLDDLSKLEIEDAA